MTLPSEMLVTRQCDLMTREREEEGVTAHSVNRTSKQDQLVEDTTTLLRESEYERREWSMRSTPRLTDSGDAFHRGQINVSGHHVMCKHIISRERTDSCATCKHFHGGQVVDERFHWSVVIANIAAI